MHVRFRYSGKKSDAVCGFLAYFCAVLRFSDPPYAPLQQSPVSLDLCLSLTRAGKYHKNYNLIVFTMFSVFIKTQSQSFQIPPV